MKIYSHEEALDKMLGKVGTPLRDQYETETQEFLIGLALKQARQEKNLTQEQLGKMVGVQKTQISRIENGRNLTISTITRILKALNLSAKLEIENMGKVALC